MWKYCEECRSRRDARVAYCEACGAQASAAHRTAWRVRAKRHSISVAAGVLAAVVIHILRHIV
jgi:hypothetical protein